MPDPSLKQFVLGPHQKDDIRQSRSYFLIPMTPESTPDDWNEAIERIAAFQADTGEQKRFTSESFTDIFVFSHGWHRNFFGAVSAYDRFATRISVLRHRGRLDAPEIYRPLYLMLHWHSDPGENGWVDQGGRRVKRAFLENCERLFVRPTDEPEPGEDFLSVLEDIYAYFADISTPETRALSDWCDRKANELARKLDAFALHDAPGASAAEKVTAVWSAYHSAPTTRPLNDQRQKPGAFVGVGQALVDIGSFVLKVVGVVAILTFLGQRILASDAIRAILGHLCFGYSPPVAALLWYGSASAVSLAALLVSVALVRPRAAGTQRDASPPRREVNFARVLAVAILLPLFGLPLIAWLLLTYVCGGFWPRVKHWFRSRIPGADFLGTVRLDLLFDERVGRRDTPNGAKLGHSLRNGLASLGRFPIWLFNRTLSDSRQAQPLVDRADQMLAFWTMQVRGSQCGDLSGPFLDDLNKRLTTGSDVVPRFHLLGHSFGGLVIANASRRLALAGSKLHLSSLCLLMPAMASTWFTYEETLRRFVRGGIACIFSRYDTANGFFYPLANNARLAAGFVGLHSVGGDTKKDFRTLGESAPHRPEPLPEATRPARFAALVEPPDLLSDRPRPEPHAPHLLNIDASRLVFDGAPATGGAHNDIFKDDIVHLCWAVTRLETR